MKSSEWEVMSVEGNKESTAVVVGANTTVLSPDIPIRISYNIIMGFCEKQGLPRLPDMFYHGGRHG